MEPNDILSKEQIDTEVIVNLSDVPIGITPITVLNNMIDGRENVDLKSDISNPKNLALLKTMSHVYNSLEFDLPSSYIEFFIKHFLRYRISKNRMSRKELTEVLSSQVALEKQKAIQETESTFK